jgi:amino acid transporter
LSELTNQRGHGFSTAPVFLAGISTILGAILFLRFGYLVAHVGPAFALLVVLIGHVITIATALAIAEIATNLKVEGGGEYFMISRSFGALVGGTIGISLYLSQTISVAFYMIAFSESFVPLLDWLKGIVTFPLPPLWSIRIFCTVVLLVLIITKGANIGVTALWVVVSILAVSLLSFFLGKPAEPTPATIHWFARVDHPDGFFTVFAIIFPAFTGMTAGVGLSGDLKNPRRSIPLGTLSATLTGMVVYTFVVIKYASSIPPDVMAADQFAMSRIALWSPLIPIGLAAATISSAIGSILIAPRTMQALARDNIFPSQTINRLAASGRGKANEPVAATIFTSIIVIFFVSMGGVNLVAKVISMFFMITYGSLCMVSFLEHFAGNPSYRPTFRSKWWFSLIGALACFIMMVQMSTLYSIIAFISMILIYQTIRQGRASEYGLTSMIKGVLFQLTRQLQILIQRQQETDSIVNWRPSFIAISEDSLSRLAPFDILRWFSHYYGFGTFIHYIKGFLSEETQVESKKILEQLIELGARTRAGIYVDTIISPSFKTAVAQIVQIPGMSGLDNNSILFEFQEKKPETIPNIIDGCNFAALVDFNICVLRSSQRHFGYNKTIHVWLTPGDYRNANLMILLAYIVMGHPEWKGCEIELFGTFEQKDLDQQVSRLEKLIDTGRIPISQKNVRRIPWDKESQSFEALVSSHSEHADLVFMGFSLSKLTQEQGAFFKRFENIHDVLFVRAGKRISISEEE